MENEFKLIIDEMKAVYLNDKRPWMIGFSGGKDSTLLVQLVFEMIASLNENQINKTVYVVSSDTKVENPIVEEYMYKMSKLINENGEKYRIVSDMVTPEPANTFWSYIIGLGYPTPEAPGFRWCTDRLKIKPLNKYTLDKIKNNGEIIMLLGVRKAESSYRARGIEKREITKKVLIPHTDLENTYIYNPLTELPNEAVWNYLLKDDGVSPWGSDNKYLFKLYQGENLDEESSALGQIDEKKVKITANSRFGCYCCTLVKEDKSLNNFIKHGETQLLPLLEFRNWLIENRNNPEYRDSKRRNGSVSVKEDGTRTFGPYNMTGRQEILRRLLVLQNNTKLKLISEEELRYIDKIWDEEGDLSRRKLVDIYFEVYGKRLPWDEYKTEVYSKDIQKNIYDKCAEFGIQDELINRLILGIEKNKCYSNKEKTSKFIDKTVKQEWVHYDNVNQKKEDRLNEDK